MASHGFGAAASSRITNRRIGAVVLAGLLLGLLLTIPAASADLAGSSPSGSTAPLAIASATSPSSPAQAVHSVEAILVFTKDADAYDSFRVHKPAIPEPLNAPLTWHWFSGNPSAPYLADAAAILEGQQTIVLQSDTTPPTTTIDLSGTAGTNGWWRSAVKVTLTATDADSGVAGIRYRLDGQLADYAAPFDIPLDGVHILEVFAEDNAGNLEPPQTVEVKVDRTAPTLILTEPVSESNVTAGDVVVQWSAVDTTSGVGACTVSLDGSTPATATGMTHTPPDVAAGTHTVTVVCADVAGNSAQQASTFHVRAAPPPPQPTGLHPAIAVAIIAAVVLGLGVIALLKGRKKKEPEERDE